jgi:hypothetical protein
LKQSFFLVFLTFMASFLLGCHEEITYTYLMQHPHRLQTVLDECQHQTYSYCDEAHRAAQDFAVFVDQRAENPELFGQKIMEVQQQLALSLKNYLQVKQEGNAESIKVAEQAYHAQKDKLKILYAVVVATSQSILGGE